MGSSTRRTQVPNDRNAALPNHGIMLANQVLAQHHCRCVLHDLYFACEDLAVTLLLPHVPYSVVESSEHVFGLIDHGIQLGHNLHAHLPLQACCESLGHHHYRGLLHQSECLLHRSGSRKHRHRRLETSGTG